MENKKKNMNHRHNNADHTAYPSIFRSTYWGGFGFEDNQEMNTIVSNRNRFVQDFNIVRVEKRCPRVLKLHNPRHWNLVFHTQYFDHTELYRNVLGDYVLVVSPYRLDFVERDDKMEALGWQKTYPLYTTNATTYVKIVPRPLPRTQQEQLPLLQQLFHVLDNKDVGLPMLKYHLRHHL